MDIRFQPIARSTMSKDIIRMIIDMINTGKLRPGSKLPSERELMEQLKVSRSPVREALRSLTLVGLLETVPGGGTYVSENLASDMIAEQLEWSRLLTEPDIVEIIEVRDPLEIQAAGLAALRATPEALAHLREVVEGYLSAGDDILKAVEMDWEFHRTILNMAQNQLLSQLLDTIHGIWNNYRAEQKVHFSKASELDQDFVEVLEAIELGDEARARFAMERHLLHSRQISVYDAHSLKSDS